DHRLDQVALVAPQIDNAADRRSDRIAAVRHGIEADRADLLREPTERHDVAVAAEALAAQRRQPQAAIVAAQEDLRRAERARTESHHTRSNTMVTRLTIVGDPLVVHDVPLAAPLDPPHRTLRVDRDAGALRDRQIGLTHRVLRTGDAAGDAAAAAIARREVD